MGAMKQHMIDQMNADEPRCPFMHCYRCHRPSTWSNWSNRYE